METQIQIYAKKLKNHFWIQFFGHLTSNFIQNELSQKNYQESQSKTLGICLNNLNLFQISVSNYKKNMQLLLYICWLFFLWVLCV